MGNPCRFHYAGALAALLHLTAPASAKTAPPPLEPEVKPDFSIVGRSVVAELTSDLFDPASADLHWSSGFQWSYRKPLIGKRDFGWVACISLNAKNRLGGYVGARRYMVFVDPIKFMPKVHPVDEFFSICDTGPFIPPQAGLFDINPNSRQTGMGETSAADEIRKLASLRDDGIISESEFESRKAILLNR